MTAQNYTGGAERQGVSGLQTLRAWREEYRRTMSPSPLEDVGQLTAQIDMTHAHPSGVAQLFASGRARLDSLFRDAGMLRAAGRRLERVLEDQAAKIRIQGVAKLSLVVGVATWKGNAVPVLLYPVEVERMSGGRETDAVIRFTGRVHLNPVFKSMMLSQRVRLDENELFDGSKYESGTPDTSAVFGAIIDDARPVFADFDIERDIVLGCFINPDTQLLSESQDIIDKQARGENHNVILDALCGDGKAREGLARQELPVYSPFDDDPHNEYEAGDVDNVVRYAANLAGTGNSLFLNVGINADTALDAVAIASRCMAGERSVLYVPGTTEQKRSFIRKMKAHGLGASVLDLADPQIAKSIDQQLISAVGFQPGVSVAHFDQLSDELVGVRSRLTRYLGDLHGVSKDWGVSAYQTIENLARIAELETHPATTVRLSRQTAQAVRNDMPGWINQLRKAGEYGEYTVGPNDTPWYKASVFSKADADGAYRCVERLLQNLLPATRAQVASTVESCGFPIPQTVEEWGRQVALLSAVRRVLDVFQPQIFERDIDAMIEATKTKAERKASGTTMGFWERRRHVKEAKKLVRAGAQVEDLNAALKVVAKQAQDWKELVPHGGWPVLPPKLDAILETQEALTQSVTALGAVLATTVQGGNLSTVPMDRLEERLKELYSDRQALETLPLRALVERNLEGVGLGEFITDLRKRHVSQDAVEGEFQLAWWTTVFEDIVRSSAIISNQDGSALETAAARFAQVDAEHVRSVGPVVEQESMRRLSDLLFSRTQEANQLHTLLVSNASVSLRRIKQEHGQILAAAKPVIVATPSTLAALSAPEILCDVAIVDACAHMPSVELPSIVSRAKQIVIIAHRETVTSEALKSLIDMLPSVEARPRVVGCDPELITFLREHGYGALENDVATESVQGRVRLHRLQATGVPVLSTGLVESSQQEIDEVVNLIKQRAAGFTVVPVDYTLVVIALTAVFRSRLGAELKVAAAKDKSMSRFLRHVRLVGVDEVTGLCATDVILSLCFAKTSHGRLLQQFGPLEGPSGAGKLLDALALTQRDLDIVSTFGSDDMEDDRLHQDGTKLLKSMLVWAEGLKGKFIRPQVVQNSNDVLFNDLARRIRARGLKVATDYGFDGGVRIPMVVGLNNRPFALAVLTDDDRFMSVQSTRRRHRTLREDLEKLGWVVITVWGVSAFVNPDKEVDRVVARIGEIYKENR